MIERPIELVDRVRTERIAYLGPIEGDPNSTNVLCAVIGDVREVEPLHGIPLGRLEDFGNHGSSGASIAADTVVMLCLPVPSLSRVG